MSILFFSMSSLGTPLNCGDEKLHVKSFFRRAYTRSDGTFVKSTTVSEHCRAKQISDVKWQGKLSDKRPEKWPYKTESSKKWNPEESERFLEAICELPEKLWSNSEFTVYRMDKSKDGNNPATSANGILVLYDTAFEKNNVLSRIIAHEFAHEIYQGLSISNSKDYKTVTNWFELILNGKRKLISRKTGFVADGGLVSPEEDFANNVEFFLFDPSILKTKTPHAYGWISQYFGDTFKVRSCNK